MSDDRLVLAIDLGSTWCKAAYVDQAGRLVGVGRAYSRSGWAFGPGPAGLAETWQAVVRAVREAGEILRRGRQPARPEAIGIAVRGVIGVWLDAAGEPIGIEPPAGRMDARAETAEVYAAAGWGEGGPFAWSYLPSLVGRCRWLRRHHPDRFARVARAGALHTWLLHRLTGAWLADPASFGTPGPYPPAVTELSGLPPTAFPPVAAAEVVAGGLREAAAADLGLPASVPVVVGCHDGAAANIGVGAIRVGDACVTLGTNLVLRAVTGHRLPDCFGYLITADRWAFVRGAHGLAAQVDAVVAVLDGQPPPVTPARHAALTALAERSPSGKSSWDAVRLPALPPGSEAEQAHRARRALAEGHAPGTIYRAALEGLALAVRGLLDAAPPASGYPVGAHPARFVATGGAAENPLLLRCLSAVLDAPIERGPTEAGLLGAAALAAVGLGWFPDVERAAARLVPLGVPISATPQERGRLARLTAELSPAHGDAPGTATR